MGRRGRKSGTVVLVSGCVEVSCEGRGAGGDGGVDAFDATFGLDFGDLLGWERRVGV